MNLAANRSDASAGLNILMVDDDPGIRDVVSEFLGRHGYQVETAADGAEMERTLAAARPTWWCWTSCCRARTAWPSAAG